MKGWKNDKLGKISDISIGGTPSREVLQNWSNIDDGFMWVSIADMNKAEINKTNEYISNYGVNNSNAKLVAAGTLLMSFKLSIGKVAFAQSNLYTNEAICAFNNPQIDNNYLYYGLQFWNLLKDVDVAIKGATLNKEKIKNIEIFYPESTDEQRKIAAVLSTVDRTIEQTEQLIAKYRSIKQGLIQDLLTYGIDSDGNIRNPKTHKFETKNGILAPSDWEVESIGTVANTYAGGTPSTDNKEYYNGNIPWITSSEVNLDSIFEPSNYISELGLKFSNAKWIPKNNVLIAMYGATAGQVSFLNIDATANQAVLAVIAKPNMDQYYLYYQLNFNREKLLYLAQGSGQINLNKKLIDSLCIGKPKYEEQQEISKRLRSQDILIEKEVENLTKYKKIKQGLMHDLLTPTKRVKL